MTVTAINRKNQFTTNGVTTEFVFDFAITNIQQVKSLTVLDGVETEYLNFTVVESISTEGGTLTTNDVLDVVDLLVFRDTSLTQQVDYVGGGRFPADSHEQALDKLTLQNQDQQEEVDRSLKFDISNENILSLEEYDETVSARDAQAVTDANNYTNQQVFTSGTVTPIQITANIDTLQTAIDSTGLEDGMALNIAERTTGNGGGAMWDVVLASSVTPNSYNIVQCIGVPTLALVLRGSSTIKITQLGAVGYPSDDTGVLKHAATMINDGFTLDLEGLNVRIIHDGVNDNPFNPSGPNNQTSFCFIEKADKITIKNGTLTCDNLSMVSDSLVMVGLSGCKFPTFDNIHMVIQASGIPSYDANGYETFASLITIQHHDDQTLSQGLTVLPNCTFKINHPSGGSIGPQESNPIHDYSGKLVGIEAKGDTSLGDDFIITDNDICGAYFYDCTARTIWMWHSERNRICGNRFFKCGLNDTEFCNYGIRVTHYGSNSSYDDNQFEQCHMTSAGILVSNNNSLRTPRNYSVTGNKAKNCTRFDIGVNGGINASIDTNQFDNVISGFAQIRFIEQTNSEWGEISVKGNMGKDVSVLTPANEGTGFIYNSATNPLLLTIDGTIVDGCDARAAITMRLQPQIVKNSRIKNCTDHGIYYGTGIAGMKIENNYVSDCPNDYGIGGFSDSNGVFSYNEVERCFKGLRAGEGSEVYGGRIFNCTETHMEARNAKVKNVNVEDGAGTSAAQTAVSCTGTVIDIIAECQITNNGAFNRGIDAQLPGLAANNGVFGTYATGAILGAVTKLGNYDSTGAAV